VLPRVIVTASLMLALAAACTRTNIPISTEQLPEVNDTPVAAPQQNDQVLRVTILNGKFSSNSYEAQSGATQMLVISTGGPYLFEIDDLVDRRELTQDGAMVINYDTSTPGQHTMRAYLSTPDGTSSEVATAMLYITPPGGRY
jgi:hypothetical protein